MPIQLEMRDELATHVQTGKKHVQFQWLSPRFLDLFKPPTTWNCFEHFC